MSTSSNGADARSITFPLLSDEPSKKDLLSFEGIASTVVDAIFDDALDPIALGVSGSWGSGKTTVLELIKSRITVESASRSGGQVLVVQVDPWRFDPLVGPKESLIAAVLFELEGAIKDADGSGKKAFALVKRLAKRVNWSKAIQMAASTAITLQLPKLEDLPDLINGGDEESQDSETKPQGMDQFREDFEALLDSDGLKHISRVVVLVDDLDRCLPPTVVQTLEAIRLFLSAKRMSFVIAADEARVAESIQHHLKLDAAQREGEETVAELYLHKIVQTTVPIPALSRVDTQAYLFLLLCRASVDDDQYDSLVADCMHLRHTEGSLEKLEVPAGVDLDEPLAIAARLTPILYEKLRGNPRRIKRFLNDLNVRHTVASHRGIDMKPAATAKLMVLERLLKDEFAMVLGWLSRNELRDKLDTLQAAATQGELSPASEEAASGTPETPDATQQSTFTDELIRWAKLPPLLDASAVSSYLYLAASFSNTLLVAEGLPQRLRDIAANLTSTSRVDQQAVSDDTLRALSESDAHELVGYLARSTRDQPVVQKFTVQSILRIVDCHPPVTDAAIAGLKRIPTKDLKPATVLLFLGRDKTIYQPLFDDWSQGNPPVPVRTAIEQVIGSR
ncbi:KAP family P-loop NTPase fold protein [Nocardia ignorata]|uniref:KAP family P-loop NTPase fold protein n=1 Tax=Nocardia ignorata TaxID=145285 RepID=UPI000834D902|nr:P-loop NTPase fold protein [Nocardia ignorata]